MHYHYFTIEQREALKQAISARLAEQPALRSALERLHTPEFGVCEACGGDIPFTRLHADPGVRLCGRCHGA
jgi:RNA polymerase-binding transcription factor DksA